MNAAYAALRPIGDAERLARRLSALQGARAVATYERNECPGACRAAAARALLADVTTYLQTLEG